MKSEKGHRAVASMLAIVTPNLLGSTALAKTEPPQPSMHVTEATGADARARLVEGMLSLTAGKRLELGGERVDAMTRPVWRADDVSGVRGGVYAQAGSRGTAAESSEYRGRRKALTKANLTKAGLTKANSSQSALTKGNLTKAGLTKAAPGAAR